MNLKLPNWLRTVLRRSFLIAPIYILGRFRICREMYSNLEGLRQRFDPIHRKTNREGKKALRPRNETIFQNVSTDRSVEELRQDGISIGFDLPPNLVEEISELAWHLPLQNRQGVRTFLRSDVSNDGRLADGEMVSLGMAYRQNKISLLNHECVAKIVFDPMVLEVVSRYLRYWPNRLSDLELYWSFVSKLSRDEQISQGNAIDLHFDLHGFNFVMAAFYLTDTDRQSGAHVMFKESHKKKTLRMLFSESQTADSLRKKYGVDNEMVIEGKAGLGFIVDNSCYHCALTPETSNRLLLRVVYT
jgi:hypothetical protein